MKQDNVMAGLVPAIHAFLRAKVVDARPKAGHDGALCQITTASVSIASAPTTTPSAALYSASARRMSAAVHS